MELRWIERILLRDLENIKAEIAAFPDDQALWTTPPGISNSAGTLALHAAGNLRHFIGARLGGSGYVRDRDREFAARGLTRDDVAAELELAVAAVRETLGGSRSIDLEAQFPEVVAGRFRVGTGDWLIHLTTHLAFHLGQIGYLRRFLTGGPSVVGHMGLGSLATAVREPGT